MMCQQDSNSQGETPIATYMYIMKSLELLLLFILSCGCVGFLPNAAETIRRRRHGGRILLGGNSDSAATTSLSQEEEGALLILANNDDDLPQDIAGQFKILTCMSTSCAKARKDMGMDEYATFSAFYTRAQDRAPAVEVEECPCLGRCAAAPCVAIEHEDYEGTVSLEGMTPTEFDQRVFQNILWEEDADRVWNAVENAIRILASENDDDENEEDTEDGDDADKQSEGVEV